jgi:hypothetical protein
MMRFAALVAVGLVLTGGLAYGRDATFRPSCPAQFELIEFNAVLNDDGRIHLRQTIAWGWDEERSRFVVEWYQVWTGPRPPAAWRVNGHWRVQAGAETIESRTLIETTTWHDPELADREHRPCERRSGLPKRFP